MTTEQAAIWQHLRDFQLDDPQAGFRFSDRLERENGWLYHYCLRAIEEYKRFIFLARFAGHPVTPSDEVDQVWHLHLLYTRSYWKEMCEGILGADIHHGPTKGREQRDDFKDYYTRTLDAYADFFGARPPEDIWPPSDIRFKYVNFQRVNLHTHKIIKRWLPRKK